MSAPTRQGLSATNGSGPDLLALRRSVERVGRWSDGLIRLGPWGLGLDGVLSWIPGVGEAYSALAAAIILIQGFRARVPLPTLILAAALMAGRTAVSAIPLVGPLAADLLTLHRRSARLVTAAIDRRLADDAQGAGADPSWIQRPSNPQAGGLQPFDRGHLHALTPTFGVSRRSSRGSDSR